jgi:prevent-host-death family protein
MKEVTDKELQQQTEHLVRRAEAGESMVITVDGRPVVNLHPHQSHGQRWMPRDALIELLKTHSADPILRADLERIAGDTTDDLDPIQ